MAPEIFQENYDEKVDIFSIGVVFHEIWNGKLPPRYVIMMSFKF